MSASSIVPSSCSCVRPGSRFFSRPLRFMRMLRCWVGARNSNVASELETGEIQLPPSDSQEVTLRVLSRAVDEQRGHVARSTQTGDANLRQSREGFVRF